MGRIARLFNARSDKVDVKSFAAHCEDDRHHFRFIVSPEDAPQMGTSFTRKLMKQAERDLGTGLDWVAVNHWNTDNPHIHVLVRGKLANGGGLVIGRDYISRGFRLRASELTGANGFSAFMDDCPGDIRAHRGSVARSRPQGSASCSCARGNHEADRTRSPLTKRRHSDWWLLSRVARC